MPEEITFEQKLKDLSEAINDLPPGEHSLAVAVMADDLLQEVKAYDQWAEGIERVADQIQQLINK